VTTRAAARAGVVAGSALSLVAGVGLTTALAAPGGPDARRAQLHVRGTVERLHLDDFSAPTTAGDDEITYVRTSGGLVQVPASDLAQVPTGASVDVGLASAAGTTTTPAGALTSDLAGAANHDPEAGVDVASVAVTPTAAGTVATGQGVAAASTAVAAGAAAHSVTVVVVKPPGGTTPSASVSTVVSTVANGVNAYWSSMTRGAVTFTATGWPSIVSTSNVPCTMTNGSVSVSSTGAFWSEVESTVHFTPGSGKHLVVYFAGFAPCGGIAGLGTVGSGIASGGVVWINGYNTVGVIGHELGHNIGLGHSQELDCTASGVRVMDAAPASCSVRNYWDTNDIMALSWNNEGYLNASHLRYLGLLNGTDQVAPSDNGVVTLTPLETPGGLRVLTLSDGATRYVVEFRRPIGADSWLTSYPGWGSDGVTVRKEIDPTAQGSTYSSDESYLLDGNPATPDTSLGYGVTSLPVSVWIDLAGGRLGLRITSETAGGAVVEYRNGLPGTDPRYTPPARPTVSTPQGALVAGSMKVTTSAAYVPLRWTYDVSTPSAIEGAAPTMATRTATLTSKAGNGVFSTIVFRGSAAASDGTLVSARAIVLTRYLGETTSKLNASWSRRGWITAKVAGAMGGRTRLTATKGSAVVFTVAGQGFGLVLGHGAKYGRVAVYVDGHYVRTLSLRARHTAVSVAWTRMFGSYGKHTVRLVNVTGGSHGAFAFDGVVTLT